MVGGASSVRRQSERECGASRLARREEQEGGEGGWRGRVKRAV